MQSTRSACLILMKLKFSPQIFEKYPNIKFHENTPHPVRAELFSEDRQTDEETDRHDEEKSRFSKFFERA